MIETGWIIEVPENYCIYETQLHACMGCMGVRMIVLISLIVLL